MKISIASTLLTATLLTASLASAQSAQPAYTGTFHGAAHSTSGTASVYVAKDGKKTLRLSDFKTSNGPDVHVVLIAASDAQDNENFLDKNVERVELGKLKGNQGNQNYAIPEGTDLSNSKPFRSTANASMRTSARRRSKASKHDEFKGAPPRYAPFIHHANDSSAKKGNRMFRRYRVLILILAAIVLLALWYAFRPEKLIINKKVDEPPPAFIMI